MVYFEMFYNENGIIRYHYWVEGNKEKRPGVIEIDLHNETIGIKLSAEDEWERVVTAEELNNFAKAVNDERISDGLEPILDEDAIYDGISHYYADHVISELKKSYDKGNLLEKGYCHWC